MLTRELLKLAGKVVAVEADGDLFEKLQIDFAQEIATGQLKLIHGDIRDYPNSDPTAPKKGILCCCEYPVPPHRRNYQNISLVRQSAEFYDTPRAKRSC